MVISHHKCLITDGDPELFLSIHLETVTNRVVDFYVDTMKKTTRCNQSNA